MGGSTSTPYAVELKQEWLDVFYAMKLTRNEVVNLYEMYNGMDCDEFGVISVDKLFAHFGIERTYMAERIFSAFENDQPTNIDFYDFVLSLCKFCTMGSEAIAVFAFDVYDADADGILSATECLRMLAELVGTAKEHESTRCELLKLMDNSGDRSIMIERFRPFCRVRRDILSPVFAIQSKLRETCLGVQFWDSLSQRRIQLRPGYIVPFTVLMVLPVDRQMFRQLLEDQTNLSLSNMLECKDDSLSKMPNASVSDRVINRLFSFFFGRRKEYKIRSIRASSPSASNNNNNNASAGGGEGSPQFKVSAKPKHGSNHVWLSDSNKVLPINASITTVATTATTRSSISTNIISIATSPTTPTSAQLHAQTHPHSDKHTHIGANLNRVE